MAFRLKLACIAVVILLLAAAGESATDFLWQNTHGPSASASGVAAEGDRVFVAETIGNFFFPSSPIRMFCAVRTHDAWTGALLWEDRAHEEGFCSSSAIVAHDGRVFLAGGGGFDGQLGILRAYDAIAGTVLWQSLVQPTNAESFLTDLAASGDTVFAVGAVGREFAVRAYDTRTGALRWQDVAAFTNVSSATAVAVDGDVVLVIGGSTFERTIRAYDVATGFLLWHSTGNQYSPSAIAVDGPRVFTAGSTFTGDFTVRAYDRLTGQPLWDDRLFTPGGASDVVSDGRTLFVVGSIRLHDSSGSEFAVRAYDAETGRVLWMDIVGSPGTPESASAAELRGGQLIVVGSLNVLGTGPDIVVRTYDAESGQLLWDDFVNGVVNSFDSARDVAVLPHAVYVAGTVINLDRELFVRGYYK